MCKNLRSSWNLNWLAFCESGVDGCCVFSVTMMMGNSIILNGCWFIGIESGDDDAVD